MLLVSFTVDSSRHPCHYATPSAAAVGTKGGTADPPESAVSELISQESLVDGRGQFLSS